VILALVALSAINTWRKEIRGKREFDIAFELLSTIYKFKDVISDIRNPFYATGEGKTRKRSEGESEKDSKLYDRAYIVFERYRTNINVFSTLLTLRYKFEALFGKDHITIFEDVMRVRNEIFDAARSLRELWQNTQVYEALGAEIGKADQTEIEDYAAIIWEGYRGKEDKIRIEVEQIVRKAEEICTEKIREK